MNHFHPLQNWPPSIKKLVFTYVLISFIGVVVGSIFIEITTHMTPEGVVEQYQGMSEETARDISRQGTEVEREIKFPKPLKEMLITTHNHILGLSTIFLVVGFLYLLCGKVSRLKVIIAVEPFFSLLVTFGGLWVVRFLWAPFVYVVILSGVLMIAAYAWMSLVIMKACLANKAEE